MGFWTYETLGAFIGPVTKAGVVIAIAAGGVVYALENPQLTKLAMRTCFGTVICCSVTTVDGVFAGDHGTGSG